MWVFWKNSVFAPANSGTFVKNHAKEVSCLGNIRWSIHVFSTKSPGVFRKSEAQFSVLAHFARNLVAMWSSSQSRQNTEIDVQSSNSEQILQPEIQKLNVMVFSASKFT
jgi:hypothetical protein